MGFAHRPQTHHHRSYRSDRLGFVRHQLWSAAHLLLPGWLDCNTTNFGPVWHDLHIAITTTDRAENGSWPWEVRQLADAIVSDWQTSAKEWIRLLHTSGHVPTCGQRLPSYTLPSTTFHPHLIPLENTESDIWKSEVLQFWSAFCPFGYVAALFIRASAGFGDSQQDLDMAWKMLGSSDCLELDFLDRSVWGVRSLDIALARHSQIAPNATAHWAIWPKAPVISSTLGSSIGSGSALPVLGAHARALFASLLRTNAMYSYHLDASVAMSAARGEGSLPSIDATWLVRNRPVRLAAFAMPLWYGTCLVVLPLLRALEQIGAPTPQMVIFGTHVDGTACDQLAIPRLRLPPHPALSALPTRAGDMYCCDWRGHDFTVLESAYRAAHRDITGVRTADVLLCSGPLWLCLEWRKVTSVPLLAVSFTFVGYYSQGSGKQFNDILRGVSEAFGRGPPRPGTGCSGMLIFDDLARASLTLRGMEGAAGIGGAFAPAVLAFPASYIAPSIRWNPVDRRTILVMREGSVGAFTHSLKGQLWYSMLKQLLVQQVWNQRHAQDMQFRFLENEGRIAYESMVQFRAALYYPGVLAGKMTKHELVTMAIPVFFPAKEMQLQYLSQTILKRPNLGTSWSIDFNGTFAYAYDLEFSRLYAGTYFFYFDSITHLAYLLSTVDIPILQRASALMHALQQHNVREDTKFWIKVIGALALSSRHSDFQSLPSNFGVPSSDPHCVIGLLETLSNGIDDRTQANQSARVCCAASCSHCEERLDCSSLMLGPHNCCPDMIRRSLRICAQSPPPCVLA